MMSINNHITLIQLLISSILMMISSMPYNVPLQGIVGGKRTLVLLNDLVRDINNMYTCIDVCIFIVIHFISIVGIILTITYQFIYTYFLT